MRRRFNVITAWGKRLSQLFNRKCLCAVHSPSMRWFLNVQIALSAAFLRWHPACANWTVVFSSVLRNSMRSVDTSLLRMWNVGRSPAAFSFRMIVVTALIWLAFFCFSWVLKTHDWSRNRICRGYTCFPWWMGQETDRWGPCIFSPLLPDRQSKHVWFFV